MAVLVQAPEDMTALTLGQLHMSVIHLQAQLEEAQRKIAALEAENAEFRGEGPDMAGGE